MLLSDYIISIKLKTFNFDEFVVQIGTLIQRSVNFFDHQHLMSFRHLTSTVSVSISVKNKATFIILQK